jgi:hypothetical protein
VVDAASKRPASVPAGDTELAAPLPAPRRKGEKRRIHGRAALPP